MGHLEMIKPGGIEDGPLEMIKPGPHQSIKDFFQDDLLRTLGHLPQHKVFDNS